MKPPPRTRNKPERIFIPEQVSQRSGKVPSKWRRAEKIKFLSALKRLQRPAGCLEDIDCAFLAKYLPTRSISEIRSFVEDMKNEVITRASFNLKKKRWKEKNDRKPIEVWTDMASTMAGTYEQSISSAFSQMLLVSSTEPRTLRNCDPPQIYRSPSDKDRPVGRTIPFRPVPGLPVQGEYLGISTPQPLLTVKTPAPTTGPAKGRPALFKLVKVPNNNIPAPQQQPSTTAGTSSVVTSTSLPPATSTIPQSATSVIGQVRPSSSSAAVIGSSVIHTAQQPSEQHSSTSTSIAASSSLHMPISSSGTSLSQIPNIAMSSSSSAIPGCSYTHTTPLLSASATECQARFGRTSKYATKDSPRTFGVSSVVDFEKIYRYLSVINKPNERCPLSPMESAVVLDLLMSLPQELSLLDCNKLHKHLIQVYKCLSSPADSKVAREMFKDLQWNGPSAQTEAPIGQDSKGTDSEQNTACQEGDADVMGPCPPLNPFMVPIKLLMRK
uniref:snRNA-activating protein complex subunit 2 n=1 Tax=Monopterus albus TaxID=43700 RepID=UPI0009B322A4|nr:snRNA-activating protein complex subunit 2 [Monopterus albus]